MKDYILYLVIGLVIAGVIGVYFITNRKIESLQQEIIILNSNFSKINNIVKSNNRITNEDPFENTINNINNETYIENSTERYGSTANINVNQQYNDDQLRENYNNESLEDDEDTSNVSSRGKLQTEIVNLKNDINNIEDLIEDSSGESNSNKDNFIDNLNEDIDPEIYNQQFEGIQTESIDQEIINKVQENINENSIELNYKNNSSEFDDLGNTELENNSEFNNILDSNGKTIAKIEGEIQSLEDNLKDLDLNKISLEKNNQSENLNTENENLDNNTSVNDNLDLQNSSVVENNPVINIEKKSVKIKKLTDIEAQVIADKYSKKQLCDICNELSISKSGTKKKIVNRIHKNGYSFKNNSQSISNKLSVN